MNVTELDIRRVMRAHDGLTAHGMTGCSTTQFTEEELRRDHLDLAGDTVGVQRSLDWLIANPAVRGSSYGLKHESEFETGHYTTNGAFIVAAILAGRKITLGDSNGCSTNPEISCVPGHARDPKRSHRHNKYAAA